MPARWVELTSAMNHLLTLTAGLVDLDRMPTVDYIRLDSSGEMDRGAVLRRYRKSDLLFKPPPRLLAEAVLSIAHTRICSRKTCGGSLGDAGQARRAPAIALEFRVRSRAASPHSELRKEAADSISGISLQPSAPMGSRPP